MEKALLLIDYENEWLDKNSEYYVGEISEALERTNKLIQCCRKNSYKIIFITHYEENSDSAFIKGSQNTEVIASIHKEPGDILITKNRISPFFKTSLEDELKGIKQIVVAGILTNLCVRSAIQDAYDRDFSIKVIKDCCVSFNEKTQDFTFKDLEETRPEIEFLDIKEFAELIV